MGEAATAEEVAALPPATVECCEALKGYNDNRCSCDEGVIELAGAPPPS